MYKEHREIKAPHILSLASTSKRVTGFVFWICSAHSKKLPVNTLDGLHNNSLCEIERKKLCFCARNFILAIQCVAVSVGRNVCSDKDFFSFSHLCILFIKLFIHSFIYLFISTLLNSSCNSSACKCSVTR